MNEAKNMLTVIDGETLMDMKLPPTKFCVETLLPQGISILGGAPKIGKSWMVLDFRPLRPCERACGFLSKTCGKVPDRRIKRRNSATGGKCETQKKPNRKSYHQADTNRKGNATKSC